MKPSNENFLLCPACSLTWCVPALAFDVFAWWGSHITCFSRTFACMHRCSQWSNQPLLLHQPWWRLPNAAEEEGSEQRGGHQATWCACVSADEQTRDKHCDDCLAHWRARLLLLSCALRKERRASLSPFQLDGPPLLGMGHWCMWCSWEQVPPSHLMADCACCLAEPFSSPAPWSALLMELSKPFLLLHWLTNNAVLLFLASLTHACMLLRIALAASLSPFPAATEPPPWHHHWHWLLMAGASWASSWLWHNAGGLMLCFCFWLRAAVSVDFSRCALVQMHVLSD